MRRALIVLFVIGATASAHATSPGAQPPSPGVLLEPPPPTAPPRPPRRWGVFAGGLSLLLIGYGTNIGLSYGLGVERAALSFIPVFGPLALMGSKWQFVPRANTGNPAIDAPANQRIDVANDASQKIAYAVLALDFAIQVAGFSMTVAGAVPPKAARR